MLSLSPLDYGVLVGYVILIFTIGSSFYRTRSDVRDYFVASREIPTFVVVIGLAASLMSAISYLGIPSYAYRFNLVPAATLIAAPVALYIVAKALLPFFFKLNVLTSYEYLERRFGYSVRLLASCLFLLARLLWLTLVSYGPAVALKVAVPIPLPAAVEDAFRHLHIDPAIGLWVFALGTIGTAYTMLGGMRALMWTDLLQFLILFGGLLGALFVVFHRAGLDVAGAWSIARQAGRTRLFDFHLSWSEGTFWAALLGGVFLWLGDFGVDQLAVQRYLSAHSLRESQRSVLTSLLVNLPLSLLLYAIGLVLFAYYRLFPDPLLDRLMRQNPDVLLPFFYLRTMPPGVLGLMLATILAATMSCLTAGINSLSASTVVDIYSRRAKRPAGDPSLVRVGRRITILWGVVITLAASYVGNLGGGLMELSWIFLGLSATLNIGIFLTAIFLPWVGTRALWCGAAAGLAVSASIVLLRFHWLWYYSFGALSLMLVAGVMGWCLERPKPEAVDGLTYWTRRRELVAAAGRSTPALPIPVDKAKARD
jgi:sodium-coupled monocarboxylate transporter 8/12